MRYRLPSTRALVAFEAAARHCNFSRAAEELGTSQSAISRYVGDLEARLGASLFEREKQKVRLTSQGAYFHRVVLAGLENLQSAAHVLANWAPDDQITIACTHEISHLVLLPRFTALQHTVGEDCHVRVMTYEYDALDATMDPRIDILLTYDRARGSSQSQVPVLGEAVRPVCSVGFAASHQDRVEDPLFDWSTLPLLRVSKPNKGWATWEEWFEKYGVDCQAPRFVDFDNYVYLLEAAAGGRGLALGWRGFVDRHIETGVLVPFAGDYIEFDRSLLAILTPRGQSRAIAGTCLNQMAAWAITEPN